MSATTSPAAATTERLRRALEAGDVYTAIEALAEDVVFHSPITTRTTFRGRQEMAELLDAVHRALDDIRYTDDFGDETTRALFYDARVGGQELHAALHVRLDESAKVSEIHLYMRPLPSLAALTGRIGVELVRPRSRPLAALLGILALPLTLLARLTDAVAVKLVRG
jgi:hypothetical protein